MKGLFVNSVAVAVSLMTLCHPLIAWTSVPEVVDSMSFVVDLVVCFWRSWFSLP